MALPRYHLHRINTQNPHTKGQLPVVLSILDQMTRPGGGGKVVEPDNFCFNIAINACAKARDWETAMELIGRMDKGRDKPLADQVLMRKRY